MHGLPNPASTARPGEGSPPHFNRPRDNLSERCEFGFWLERDPDADPADGDIELSRAPGVEFRAIVAAILDHNGRALFIEAGVDDETGPFVSVKGLDGSAEPVMLSVLATESSMLVNLGH